MAYPNLVLIGPAGSGKGTQASLLEEAFGYEIVEAGSLLRAAAAFKTPEGQKIAAIIKRGDLVDEKLIISLMMDRVKSVESGVPFLFDGYPRTVAQYKTFLPLIDEIGRGKEPLYAIFLNLGLEEAKRRIMHRSVCQQCRAVYPSRDVKKCRRCQGPVLPRQDDTPQTIEKRHNLFQSETKEVIAEFKKLGRLIEINAEQPIVHVFDDIKNRVMALSNQRELAPVNEV